MAGGHELADEGIFSKGKLESWEAAVSSGIGSG